jgi:hypothetical protein
MKIFTQYLAMIFAAMPCTLSAQEWIPAGTKVCYKLQYEDGLLPDATFCLKLKITQAQFDAIVIKLGTTLHTESRKYGDDKKWLEWRPDKGAVDPFTSDNEAKKLPPKGENLWDPDADLSKTYVRQHKDTWTFLKYERGYLYFAELSH